MNGMRNNSLGTISALVFVTMASPLTMPVPHVWGQETVLDSRDGTDVFLDFSFKNVSIPAFVEIVGEITGKKIVISDDVTQKITVVSPKVKPSEVYPLFNSILESAGCSVVVEGDVYRIVKLPERDDILAPVIGANEALPQIGVITKVFRLEHVAVGEFRNLLMSKVSGGRMGAVGAIDATNHLIITDTAENVRRIEKIIREIDQPGMSAMTEVVSLKFASAESIADELAKSIGASATDGRGAAVLNRIPAIGPESSLASRRLPLVVASPHSNSLILVGSSNQIAELTAIIARIDVDFSADHGRLNAIFLKYISAEEAAENLKALLANRIKDDATAPGQQKIGIQADTSNNALLVESSPGDFEVVKRLVDFIDNAPEQVHIEVVIAELSEGDNLDIGVDMAAFDSPKLGESVLQGGSVLSDSSEALMNAVQKGVLPGGLTVGVAHGSRLDASGNVLFGYPGIININAIKSDSRFKIRSSPSLMAQNNKEASVSIVNEIPVQTSSIQGGTGSSRDVVQNIDRVPVGIKLKLTPHIIPGGLVRMELNPSIEAVVDPGPEGSFTPTIAKREVSTTVTVPDGELIIIAGLTQQNETKTVRRVPLLGAIPLLGWLFRHTVIGEERTDLLIFVTPVIVKDSVAAAAVSDRLTKRTGLQANEED
ncbi:MAG: type II secretion system secretin GspD [Verrucomicrobia bacterium]|nr:type II secretion system secretin GspD [Verrucomicrobiota bacterium]